MWRELKAILYSVVLALSVSGCASMFACKTEVSYNADGSWSYASCKNQENLTARLAKDDKTGKLYPLEVTTTALTPESAIAAALSVQMKILEQMSAILTKLSATGAGS